MPNRIRWSNSRIKSNNTLKANARSPRRSRRPSRTGDTRAGYTGSSCSTYSSN
ncbi:hypothetical protein JCM19046_2671 [Bacillus sp. JCM 19046]|nr:hypothetical protein JCM19046_2671 [Bacillus sp. JCM 19046]